MTVMNLSFILSGYIGVSALNGGYTVTTREVIAELLRVDPCADRQCRIELCDKHFVSDYREIGEIAWEPQEGVVALIPDEEANE